ncbi:MAG: hypothetical protein SVM86_02820 [Candidatus Cloacimonadota bacterium]|nr:hypothetical protein [Candidatus Cloacimonadota bacterium]
MSSDIKNKKYSYREGNPQGLWQSIKSGKAFKMLFRGEIPERFRSWDKFVKYNRKIFFQCIHKTPPIACQESANVAIHSLVCHIDMEMYLLAIKSFLRFYNHVQIFAHSDGSLNSDDKTIMQKHIPNIKIIDETNKLWQHTLNKVRNDFIAKGCGNILLTKLFLHFFSTSKKIIILDTDIIFLKRPDELIDWIEDNNKNLKPLYNKDRYDTLRDAKERLEKEFNITKFPPHFNAGLICMKKDISKEEIEKLLPINFNYHNTQLTKGDQTIHHIMLARRNAQPLDSEKYNIFDGKEFPKHAKMIHFPYHVRFKKNVYLKLAKKNCKQLKKH